MTNWANLHPNFKNNPELIKKWTDKGFTYQQVELWTKLLGNDFDTNDYDLFDYLVKKFKKEEVKSQLESGEITKIWSSEEADFTDNSLISEKKEKKLNANYVLSYNEEEILRKEYPKLSTEIIEKIKNWPRNEFGYLQLTPEKQLLLEQLIPNQKLREKFRYCGLCKECSQPNTASKWCRVCNVQHWQREFNQWTSGNLVLDAFLQKHQLLATDWRQVLEWIPYDKFTNVEHIAKGGFGTVSKATWLDGGPIERWSIKHKKWHRKKGEKEGKRGNYENVALKSFNHSQNLATEILQEVVKHRTIGGWVIPCYGISQDPKTKNYSIVTEYKKDGDLRHYLQSNKIDFIAKLLQLYTIVDGLKDIHNKEFIHHDLHPGNILIQKIGKDTFGFITDFGLCQPINEKSKDKIYGVLPYVAPEVLCGKKYTQPSDIYSFSIIAYEVITDFPPYHNIPYDRYLAEKIMKGLRPNLNTIEVPQLLKDLIKQCWDADPSQRPTANKIKEILFDWWIEAAYKRDGLSEDTLFTSQSQVAEEYNKSLLTNLTSASNYKVHSSVSYISHLLDFKNLPEPQNSKEINNQFWNSKKNNISQLPEFSLSELQKVLEETEIKDGNNQLSQPIEFNTTEINRVNWEEIMEESTNWTTLHPNFTNEIIQQWQENSFTYSQTQDWLSAGLSPTDSHFAAYLRDQKQLTPETALNQADYEQLKSEYQNYQTQQEQPPK